MVVGIQLEHMQIGAIAVLVAPLLSALVNMLWGRHLGNKAHIPALVGMTVAWVASIVLLIGSIEGHVLSVRGYTWLALGRWTIDLGLQVDALTAATLVTFTIIGLAAQVCAIGQLRGEAAYARYFALVDFAAAAAAALVLADNFATLLVAWTALGLCSCLLIGFRRDDETAVAAAAKTAVFELVSTALFALGLWGLLAERGGVSFAALEVDSGAMAHVAPIALLLCGAVACRSAQFPWHTWTADATAAPAPASVWIHALSGGLAGVYILARTQPLLAASPLASQVLAGVGIATALLAIFLALVAADLRRVLAYVAASQFGFVFAALGLGAYVAGVFHGFVLAFALALLFLASGAIGRAAPQIEDVWKMGGLGKHIPAVFWTFMSAALVLAGALPVSGFWSRNDVLTAALDAGDLAVWIAGCAASLATSLCAFRLIFLVFWGEPRSDAATRVGKLPASMYVALAILAFVCIALGGVGYPPGGGFINRFLEPVLGVFAQAGKGGLPHTALMAVTTSTAILGAVLAWALYGRSAPDPARDRSGALLQLLTAEYYVETVYKHLLVRPLQAFARFLWDFVDTVVLDLLLVNGSALCIRGVGWILGRLHNGQVGTYVLIAVAGVVAALSYLVF